MSSYNSENTSSCFRQKQWAYRTSKSDNTTQTCVTTGWVEGLKGSGSEIIVPPFYTDRNASTPRLEIARGTAFRRLDIIGKRAPECGEENVSFRTFRDGNTTKEKGRKVWEVHLTHTHTLINRELTSLHLHLHGRNTLIISLTF